MIFPSLVEGVRELAKPCERVGVDQSREDHSLRFAYGPLTAPSASEGEI